MEEEAKRRQERKDAEEKRKQEEDPKLKKWVSFSITTCREGEYKRALNEGLRRQYLGAVEEEVKPKRHREQFMMQWHNEDDTSDKLDPLYRNVGKAHLAFGKGYVAGVDMRKQRKDSQYMESLLSLREQAVGVVDIFHAGEGAWRRGDEHGHGGTQPAASPHHPPQAAREGGNGTPSPFLSPRRRPRPRRRATAPTGRRRRWAT